MACLLGPLLSFGGAVSYFLYFVRFPALRDTPWLNVLLVGVGVGISLLGLRRVIALGAPIRTQGLGILSFVFSLFVGGLFVFYLAYLSYQMPTPSSLTSNLKMAPEFALHDQESRVVSLSDFAGKKLVLTFYRGHW